MENTEYQPLSTERLNTTSNFQGYHVLWAETVQPQHYNVRATVIKTSYPRVYVDNTDLTLWMKAQNEGSI